MRANDDAATGRTAGDSSATCRPPALYPGDAGGGPEEVAGATASRTAAAVIVAAIVPIEIGPKRPVSPAPDARQNATSPSTSEWTGSTARATPPLAIRATREQAALSSAASVITQASVVFRSSSRDQSGGPSIAATRAAVESAPASSPLGPASTCPSSPITSPNAFTTASTATVSPRPLIAAA